MRDSRVLVIACEEIQGSPANWVIWDQQKVALFHMTQLLNKLKEQQFNRMVRLDWHHEEFKSYQKFLCYVKVHAFLSLNNWTSKCHLLSNDGWVPCQPSEGKVMLKYCYLLLKWAHTLMWAFGLNRSMLFVIILGFLLSSVHWFKMQGVNRWKKDSLRTWSWAWGTPNLPSCSTRTKLKFLDGPAPKQVPWYLPQEIAQWKAARLRISSDYW